MTPLRIVVAGTGFVSQFWLPTLVARSDVEIVGFAEPDPEPARRRLEEYGLDCPVAPTVEEAVAATDADVVACLTPPDAHRRVVEAALATGCHVLCEKPLATTMDDALAMVAASDRTGCELFVMQNRRYAPAVRRLRDGVAGGAIGVPTYLAADMFMAPTRLSAYVTAQSSPLLQDMAIHTFDQARFLGGADPIAGICHEHDPPGSPYPGPAVATCTWEMSDGSVFSYRGNWVAPGLPTDYDGQWRIVGTRGTVLWDSWTDPVADVPDGPAGPAAPVVGSLDRWAVAGDGTGFARCLTAMLDALADGRRAETDCRDHVVSLAMVFAALISARERRWVAIDELLPL